jgi:3-carboxy-cis,cis-muconate cycloisomerase
MSNAFTSNGMFGQLFQDTEVSRGFSSKPYLQKMLTFERAWTDGLIHLGVVTQADGAAALAAIDAFKPDMTALGVGTDRDGLPLPELVRQLRVDLPTGAQEAIHTGATSQDVLDMATVLTCLDLLGSFETRMRRVLAKLDTLEAKFGSEKMMGRTRMQAALPMLVGDRLRSWRAPLENHLIALPALMQNTSCVQIGGAVGLRDKPKRQGDAMAAHVAERLGLAVGHVWHTDRTSIVNIGHWLMLISGTLGKIGLDVMLMAQQGVDEIAFDGAGGSSAMPHKQNPVRAEALVTLARYVAGQQGLLGQTMLHEQERSGAAWALEWMILPAMFEATGAALRSADEMLGQVARIGAAPAI